MTEPIYTHEQMLTLIESRVYNKPKTYVDNQERAIVLKDMVNFSQNYTESYVQAYVETQAGDWEPAFLKNSAFNKNFGTVAGTVAEGNDQRILNGATAFSWGNHTNLYSPLGHTHTVSDISDITNVYYSKTEVDTILEGYVVSEPESLPAYAKSLTSFLIIQGDTDQLYEPIFSKNSAFNKNFGSTAGTIAEGNDSRINNGQTAFGWGNHAGLYSLLGHTHTTSDITNLAAYTGFDVRYYTEAEINDFFGGVGIAGYNNNNWDTAYIYSQVGHIPLTEKGANNGVATLDAGGKVPISQLPSTLMVYVGTWNASTNSPTLGDGVGTAGHVYKVTGAPTATNINLGSGNIEFTNGDYIIYNGTSWEKSDGTDAVTNVNGQQGIVTLYTDHISEDGSPINLWYTQARFDTAFSAKSTTNLTEGTNLYYTNTRVQTYGNTLWSLLGHTHTTSQITNLASYAGLLNYYLITEIQSIFSGVAPITGYNRANWDTAYSWGNHAGLYPTYAGVGATGTWGINISGTATTATNWSAYDGNAVATPTYLMAYNGTSGKFGVSTAAQVAAFINGQTFNTLGNAATATLASQLNIAYNDNSNGNYQILWGSGVGVYGTAGVILNAFTDIITASGFTNNGWFRNNTSAGISGDYAINGTTDKVIWTIGTSWESVGLMYGIGYSYVSSDHNIVFRHNGSLTARIVLSNGAFHGSNFIGNWNGYTYATAATASTVALRDGSGHIFANHFNQGSGNDEGGTISQLMYTNGSDNYLRKAGILQVQSALGLGAYLPIVGGNITTYDLTTSASQGRFGGWNAGGGFTGMAVEVGTSGGIGNVLTYNRATGTYGSMYVTALTLYLQSTGGNINIQSTGGNIRMVGTVESTNHQWFKESYFGYSSSYKTLVIGATTGLQTILFGVDTVANPSGSFQGNGTDYIWRNVGQFITPNAGNTGYNGLFSWSSGVVTFTSTVNASVSGNAGFLYSYSLGTTSTNLNTGYNTGVYRNENGLGGNFTYSPVLHVTTGDTTWQLNANYGTTTSSIQYRSGYNGNYGAWTYILTALNYNNYSPTLTGTGASGTWSINVTGNAATASNSTLWAGWSNNYASDGVTLGYLFGGDGSLPVQRYYTAPVVKTWLGLGSNAYTSTSYYHNNYQYGLSVNSADANTVNPDGGFIQSYYTGAWLSNGAVNYYGGLISWSGGNNSMQIQYTNGHSGSSNYLYHRAKNSSGWVSWKQILDSSNYIDYAYSTNGLVDPANHRFYSPAGATYVNSASSATGAIKIALPAGSTSKAPMLQFTVNIYEYITGQSVQLRIGGHFSGSSWHNVFAHSITDSGPEYLVTFGYEGGRECVWIGVVGKVWSYPQVYVTDFQNGYASIESSWASDWAVSFVTTLGTVTNTRYAARALNSNNYNSYSPTLIGGGASGTWGINISGTAASETLATVSARGATTNSSITIAGNLTVVEIYSSGWFRNASAATGLYNTALTGHFYQTNLQYWSINPGSGATYSGLRFATTHEGTPKGYVYWDSSGFGLLNDGGGWSVRANYGTGYGGELYGNWIVGGTLKLGVQGTTPYGQDNLNGITFGGESSSSDRTYRIYTQFENWSGSGNYSKLTLSWHTGIRIGGSSAYGGTRFYNNSPESGIEIFNVGKGDNNVRAIYGMYAYSFSGSGNVDGTGSASHHPSGIYSLGTNWLYGTVNMAGYNINGAGTVTATTFAGNLSGTWGGYGNSNYMGMNGYSYWQANTSWIEFKGTPGLYWSNPGSGYNEGYIEIYVNSTQTYGAFNFLGRKGAFQGILWDGTTTKQVTGMFDSAGNGGWYAQASSTWQFYWYVSHSCLGVGSSDTTAGYKLQVNGALKVTSSSLFYDNLHVNDYGIGLVGIYSDTRYQAVFAMSNSYKMNAGGTSIASLYGLAWTHSNIAGQSKAGLSHQLLIVEAGVTTTALGTGVWTSGDVVAYGSSDRRLKDNIRKIDDPLGKLSKLSGNYFEWNNLQSTYEVGSTDIGVIADEVEKIFPEITTTRNNALKTKAVKYERLIPVLLEGVKELTKKDTENTRLIKELKEEVKQLRENR